MMTNEVLQHELSWQTARAERLEESLNAMERVAMDTRRKLAALKCRETLDAEARKIVAEGLSLLIAHPDTPKERVELASRIRFMFWD